MFDISLFSILTFVAFIYAYNSKLISMVVKLIPQDPLITSTTADIISLKKQLSTISMVDEFAKHVKLQRKITKLKDDKEELVKKQMFRVMKIRYSLMTVLYVVILGSLIILVWYNRSKTVAQLPAHWLWPVSSFFNWSDYIPGSFSVPCWVVISCSATKTLARHF